MWGELTSQKLMVQKQLACNAFFVLVCMLLNLETKGPTESRDESSTWNMDELVKWLKTDVVSFMSEA